VASVTVCVFLSVCLHCKNKKASAINTKLVCLSSLVLIAEAFNTKLDRHTLHGSLSACVDPEVKGQTISVTQVIKCSTSMGMHVDRTA